MLLELKVKDLGIIEEINWSLEEGLNVISGETGAGKSLVIDAVEALLAGKVDEEVIRHGAREARIEGVFALTGKHSTSPLKQLLVEKGLKVDEQTLVISCDLRRQGRSVARVNGHAVPRGLLQQIGRLLVDIHGQSQHLSLYDTSYHLNFLDAYAHTLDMRDSFSAKVAELNKAEQEIQSLAGQEKDMARRQEYLRFQIEEIARARLHDGEDEELETEKIVLTSAEKLKSLSYEAYQALYQEDSATGSTPALDRLNQAIGSLKRLVELDPTLKQQLASLEDAAYELEEVARDIQSYSDGMEHNPQRLEEVESRLELMRNLKKKYGQTIAEVLDYHKKAQVELEGLSLSSERRLQLEETWARLKQEMGLIASSLSLARSKAAKKLVAEVKKELKDLSMAQVDFEVYIRQEPDEAGIPLPDGKCYSFDNQGVDTVEFMVATNPGEPLKPLARIASTGEISRFTLALKGALSQVDHTPVLIFDEIDIGVGGRSGEIIGKKLWALAQDRQVICVTHLPQIAAFADAHYNVHKGGSGKRTLSQLKTLQGDSRIEELAVMLAGPQHSETSAKDALELAQKAEAWKKSQRKAT